MNKTITTKNSTAQFLICKENKKIQALTQKAKDLLDVVLEVYKN